MVSATKGGGIRMPMRGIVAALLVLVIGMIPADAVAVECENPEQCEDPCPAENSCDSDADCGDGFECVPYDFDLPCVPSGCFCDNGAWACTDDCAAQCLAVPGVPATSFWGTVILVLLLLAVTPMFLARRRSRVTGAD